MARKSMMVNVTYDRNARVYTAQEVKAIVQEVKMSFARKFEEKAAILAEADVADQNKILTVIYLSCLMDMGLQKGGMENFMERVADACEAINEDETGAEVYNKMKDRVEGTLGYSLFDRGVTDRLTEMAREVCHVSDGEV